MTFSRKYNDAYDALHELANAVTHGLGLALSIAGAAILIVLASIRGDRWVIGSCAVFGATLILLYGASTLYHSFRHPHWKQLLRKIDHSAIYLLIAGTYTPFTLTYLRGPWGYSLLAAVWTMAIAGCVFQTFFVGHFPKTSTAIYVLMGWMALVAAKPILATYPLGLLAWIAAGGLLYTSGVIFFAMDGKLRFNHAIWHLFVLGGSMCHYMAVLLYVVPRT